MTFQKLFSRLGFLLTTLAVSLVVLGLAASGSPLVLGSAYAQDWHGGEPPGLPSNLTATGSYWSVTLEWDPPIIGDPVVYYEYRYQASDHAYGLWTSTGDVATSHTVDHLDVPGVYYFQLRAVSASGPGQATVAVSAQVGPPNTSGLRSISATGGDGRLFLHWQPPWWTPADFPVQGYAYKLYRSIEGQSLVTLIQDWTPIPGGADVRSYTVSGLDNGKLYLVFVRALYSGGPGWSDNIAFARTATTEVPPLSSWLRSGQLAEILINKLDDVMEINLSVLTPVYQAILDEDPHVHRDRFVYELARRLEMPLDFATAGFDQAWSETLVELDSVNENLFGNWLNFLVDHHQITDAQAHGAEVWFAERPQQVSPLTLLAGYALDSHKVRAAANELATTGWISESDRQRLLFWYDLRPDFLPAHAG